MNEENYEAVLKWCIEVIELMKKTPSFELLELYKKFPDPDGLSAVAAKLGL